MYPKASRVTISYSPSCLTLLLLGSLFLAASCFNTQDNNNQSSTTSPADKKAIKAKIVSYKAMLALRNQRKPDNLLEDSSKTQELREKRGYYKNLQVAPAPPRCLDLKDETDKHAWQLAMEQHGQVYTQRLQTLQQTLKGGRVTWADEVAAKIDAFETFVLTLQLAGLEELLKRM